MAPVTKRVVICPVTTVGLLATVLRIANNRPWTSTGKVITGRCCVFLAVLSWLLGEVPMAAWLFENIVNLFLKPIYLKGPEFGSC